MQTPLKCLAVTAAVLVALVAASAARAQPVPGDCEPQDLSVNLNTGWDQSTGGSVFSDGDPDDDWDITLDASSGPVPRDADVTAGVGAWLTFPDSAWITADFTGPAGWYTYETCWCMDDNALNPVLDFMIRTDNSANIFLNANFIDNLPGTTFNDTPAPAYTITDPSFFTVGLNCLTVDVQNWGGPTGMNLAGDVTADDGLCCGCDPENIVDDASTGVDDATGGLIGSTLDDDEWIVTAAASGGTLPRPAEATDAQPFWDTIPGTKWITAQLFAQDGLYTYEKCWCMNDAFENAQLDMQLLADNEADVYLNGTLIGSTPPNAYALPATTISTNDQALFLPGENCLTIDVTNIDLVTPSATGLDASIQISATNAECCGCIDAPTGLEAWWPLDETTGTTAFDIISGHDGTHTDFTATPPSPTPAFGYVLGSLQFDGADDHVDVPDDPGLDFGPNEDLSIDAWINTENPLRQVIVGKKRPGINPGFSFGMAAGFVGMEISDGTTYVTCIGSTAINDGDWHFVAVTLDRNDPVGLRLFVDGVIDAVCDPTPIPPAGSLVNLENLYIGGDPLQGPEGAAWWLGRLDEIELFRRALSDTEIEELYLAGTSGKCPPIPCEDSTGVPVCDGTCPSGMVCDYTGVLSDPCGCIAETVPCDDSDYPVCDGICPIGMTCQAGPIQDCECLPIPGPCEQSPFPECNGPCLQGGTCEPNLVTGNCDCIQPQPCETGPYPVCDGDCPPGDICVQGPVQNCICEPAPQCGDPGDYPTCDGPCPLGSTCDYVPGTQQCDCFDDAPQCGDTQYPTCGGVCPVGEECLNVLGTDDCKCEPAPPSCGDTLYPVCDGACPVDQKCVKLQSGLPGCECVDCGTLGTGGFDDVIEIAWPNKKDQLRWSAGTCAYWYNVYRLTADRLVDLDGDGLADDYGSCYLEEIIEREAREADTPTPGQCHWYLITGENFTAEGSLGETSDRLPRPNTGACP